jgi:diacylglycerol kinase family enzyme
MSVPVTYAAAPPFVLVVNKGSGHQSSRDSLAAITGVFVAAARAHEVIEIEDPRRIAVVARRALQRARECHGIVVAVGGDGTLNAVAQVMHGSGIAYGVIPQGTFNYFGRAHGIPQEAAAAATALLRATPQPVQVGRVNDRLFLVNASVGLYPQLLEDREAFKRQYGRSRWVALWAGLWSLMRQPRRLRLEIRTEQGTRQVRTPTLFVGNNALQLAQIGVDQAATVARPEGRLVAIQVRPIGTWAMLGLALRGALGRLGEAEQVETFAFHHMRIGVPGHRRIKVATDGEIRVMRTPLVIEPAAKPLLLLVPAPEDRAEVA